MRRFVHAAARIAVIASITAAAVAARPSAPSPHPATVQPPPSVSFDIVVVDKDGRAPDGLNPADLMVSVDGKARRVVAVRRVSRGPGAVSDATARSSRSRSVDGFAAEPGRNILLVVDQAGLVHGEERAVLTAGRALLDRVGIGDRLAVVLLPLAGAQMLSLATEQPVAREALARANGQVLPSVPSRPDDPVADLSPSVAGEPVRERAPDAQPVAAQVPAGMQNAESAMPRVSLGGLGGMLQAIRSLPGRKVVALFSAGVSDASARLVNDLAADAVAARATIYAFGLPAPRDDVQGTLQAAPLEVLAKATGGTYAFLGRNAERTIGRVVAELGTCFVLDLEAGAGDTDGKRHTLRVELANRALSVRAPAWLVPMSTAEDVPVARPEAAPVEGATAAPPASDAKPARAPENPSGRDVELQVAMGKLIDYSEAYARQYSGLVAEEEYRQTASRKSVRLRSDYLLVKPEHSEEWVSFRDVYEVDGVAVRDRDDRLRRLFLEPGAQKESQLAAIVAESARYNIGAVERNINVPLFPLRFLKPQIRPRFRFKLAGKREVAGAEVWRVDYEELGRPTVITNLQDQDVPAKGWFLVEQTTGALVEYSVRIEGLGSSGEIVVSFRRDPALGMWVPQKMTETYLMAKQDSARWGSPRMEAFLEGSATYSKYRRFQVKTEEKVVIPK